MDPPLADDSPPATTSAPQSSYADKLKGNPRPQELADRAARKAFNQGVDTKVIGSSATINGRKTIFLSKEEDNFMAAPFQYSLVGKFSHRYPTMTRLRAKFDALGLLKGFKLGLLDNKHIWIRLYDPNDYTRIWLKQIWYFDGFPMRVLKWTPDFDPKEESPIMPIWVKILGLKPHWFHHQFLYHVASLIGKSLKLDEATTVIDNPTVARICVEINVLDRLQQDIPVQVEGKMCYLKLQYEGIPQYCTICRHRGHTISVCMARMEKPMSEDDPMGLEDITEPIWREKGDLRCQIDKLRGKSTMEGPIKILKRWEKGEGSNVNGDTNNSDNIQNTVDESDSEGEDGKIEKDSQNKEPIVTKEQGVNYSANGMIIENNAEDVGKKKSEVNNMELVSFLEENRNLMYLGNNIVVPENEEEYNSQEHAEEPWREVSHKKHRRAVSLDRNSPRQTALVVHKMATRNIVAYFTSVDYLCQDTVARMSWTTTYKYAKQKS
ncbi:hypothetical protein BUALT_Bualt13G0067000 [Buddleja alternifolia]|uniref:DUF4283 domain-containing protein n=1 Tax=Buddleja alternifolia TaxID=168488 RepID=A0AAV6WTT6_9LAMI|nr:hypothetical protein BUALT_Bualt13G0067000 [Buddleja alternifolia]